MALDAAYFENMAQAYSAAWSSGSAEAVASFYAEDGQICINRGDVLRGRAAIAEMAAGFHAECPGLVVSCDQARLAGDHATFLWTLTGTHAETGNAVSVPGWEEWDLDADGKISASLGWFDAHDYDRQVAGG